MEIGDYLAKNQPRLQLPNWLDRWDRDSQFLIDDFLSSDVVFYPGGNTDGQPIRLFNQSCGASCFLYADYLDSILNDVNIELNTRPLLGYNLIDTRNLALKSIFHNFDGEIRKGWFGESVKSNESDKVGELYIFQKEAKSDVGNGADKIALLYLQLDAFSVFENLFGQQTSPSPFAILLADHGFGGNYDCFGEGGLLEKMALERRIFPNWLLMDRSTNPWKGYQKISKLKPDIGGMHRNCRYLYKRILQVE